MSTAARQQYINSKSQSPSDGSRSVGLVLQRKCACGGYGASSLTGECEACKLKHLQRKLSIGASNDPLEHEADRVADQVMAMSPNSGVSMTPLHIQRFTGPTVVDTGTVTASVDRVLASSGRPLDTNMLQNMGQRFGYDFSCVRVHTGLEAEKSAEDIEARAYTAGNNIIFGSGQFSPGSFDGQKLIAHELAHVVQQTRIPSINVGKYGLPISSRLTVAEKHNDLSGNNLFKQNIPVSIESGDKEPTHQEVFVQRQPRIEGRSNLRIQRDSHTRVATSHARRRSPAKGTKDPSCEIVYGRPNTPETRVLVSDKQGVITRVRENLDSWTPYLLKNIPDIVNELYESQEEVNWFATFATKVVGEVIGSLGEEMEPVKLLIVGLAEIGEHVAEKELEKAKKTMNDRITERITRQRDDLRISGETFVNDYFEIIRGRTENGCGNYLHLLYDDIEKWWPRMTSEKLGVAKQLVEQIVKIIEHEELIKNLREQYEECMRIGLERPGGVPTKQEEDAVAEECRSKTGYPM